MKALPAAGEKDFGLRELTSYSYAEAVSREVLKPEDFKLDRQPGLRPLLDGMAAKPHGVVEVQLGGRGQLMAWSEVPQTGWRLLLVWAITAIGILPRLVAGAHWGADAFVGGVFLSLLALAWSCYTPLGYRASEWLEKVTLPITSRLARLPLLGRLSIVSGR